MNKSGTLTAITGWMLVASGNAQNNQKASIYDLTLKELLQVKVVTAASGFEQKLQRASANATVIYREEWQAIGAYTLSDILATLPGVHPTKPQLNYNHNLISIRGMKGSFGEQVKLLIDGVPFEYVKDSGTYVGFDMPIEQFKRIEVIKGPGSAIYGADAFAGVINLVSFDTDKVPSNLMVRGGQFNSKALSFSHGFNLGDHHLGFALDHMRSDDDPGRIVYSDLQTLFDGLFGTNASNAPGPIDESYDVFNFTTRWQWQNWSLKYHTWRNFHYGLGPGVAQALDNTGEATTKNDTVLIDWDISDKLGIGQMNIRASWINGKVDSYLLVFPAGAVLPIGADGNLNLVDGLGMTQFSDGYIGTPSSRHVIKTLTATHVVERESHKLRWEAGYSDISFRPIEYKNFGPSILDGTQAQVDGNLTDVSNTPWVYVPQVNRHYYYLSLLDEWQIDPQWLLSLGARFDSYSDFGTTINPRISLRYDVSENIGFKLFGGSAFRAPSIGELHYQNNPINLGNPNLGPEGVDTYESGLGLDLLLDDNLYINVSLFNYQAKDLIESVRDPQRNISTAQNIGSQKGRGGELSLRWKPQKAITFNVSYSHLSSQKNQQVPTDSLPHKQIKWDMNWRINERWYWAFDTQWIKARHRPPTDTRDSIADYNLFNTRLAYNSSIEGLTVALKAKNLFESDAREPSNGNIADDFPLAGRQWMVEVSYRL